MQTLTPSYMRAKGWNLMINMHKGKKEAVESGFAGFNSGQHITIDGTRFETQFPTVSIKVADDVYVTVSLLPKFLGADVRWEHGHGHYAVDVAMHCNGEVKMNCLVLGAGPTYYASQGKKDSPTIVSMYPKKENE